MWSQEVKPGLFYMYKKIGRKNVYVGKKHGPAGLVASRHGTPAEFKKFFAANGIDVRIRHDMAKEYAGLWYTGLKQIQLNGRMSSEIQKETLVHESHHAVIDIIDEESDFLQNMSAEKRAAHKEAKNGVTDLVKEYNTCLSKYVRYIARNKADKKLAASMKNILRRKRLHSDNLLSGSFWKFIEAKRFGFPSAYSVINPHEFIAEWSVQKRRPAKIQKNFDRMYGFAFLNEAKK